MRGSETLAQEGIKLIAKGQQPKEYRMKWKWIACNKVIHLQAYGEVSDRYHYYLSHHPIHARFAEFQ